MQRITEGLVIYFKMNIRKGEGILRRCSGWRKGEGNKEQGTRNSKLETFEFSDATGI